MAPGHQPTEQPSSDSLRPLIQHDSQQPTNIATSRNTPEKARVVTIQHRDARSLSHEGVLGGQDVGDHKEALRKEYANAPPPPSSYSDPYEIPFSPVDMPTPQPYQPRSGSISQPIDSYQGDSGLVRKVSTRIQQAIEAVKVPYQPIYHAGVDEEADYRHGHSVDLHGELKDEWEMAPVKRSPSQPVFAYQEVEVKIPGLEAGEADTKAELSDDEKYLVNYSTEDPRHPYNWSNAKKYSILLVLCLAAVCVTATSSIQASTYASIEREFGLSRPEAVLGVSLYVLGLGLGSMFLGPMSEFFGRCYIYLISFFLFTVCNVPIATARNGGVFLFFRLLTGLCGSGFLSIAGGSVADMFRPGTVDIPMALYTLAPLVGPCLGPLLGGFINQNTSFRVTFYTVIAWSGATFVLLYFFVPETFLPKILQREAVKKRLETGDGRWYAPLDRTSRTIGDVFPSAMWQPIQMMVKEPMALILNCWTALVLGVIYLFFNAIPFTFRTVYGFDLQTCGLCFIPMAIGMTIGTACQWFFIRAVRDKAIRAGGKAPPEARLPVGMAGAVLCPIGLLWFALSSLPEMTFFMPMIGIAIFGVGSVFVFTCVWGFLVASFPRYAASAMAGNTLVRCIWAAGFPLFADPMYRGLGAVKATSVLAGAAAAMAPIPFVLYFFGSRWRSQSIFSK